MKMSYLYVIDYPLPGPPNRLGFRQQFQDAANPMPVSVELTVRQEGRDSGSTIPVPSGASPEEIAFQWEGPSQPAVETHLARIPANAVSRYWMFLARASADIQTKLLDPASHYWLFLGWVILLGALHGLEPGHSKGLMSAFIIGTRGSFHQAIALALSATFSHTAIVWLLAWPASWGGAMWLGRDVGAYLNLISGIVIVTLSVWMLLRMRGPRHAHDHLHGHAHSHSHDHSHSHTHGHGRSHTHSHPHNHDHTHADLQEPSVDEDAHTLAPAREIAVRFSGRRDITISQVILFGLGSGLSPCTAAVVILISCFRLHQLWMGFGLVAAFSIGLGLTLCGVAVAASWGARIVGRRWTGFEKIAQKAPQLSSLVTAIIGVYFVLQFLRSRAWR